MQFVWRSDEDTDGLPGGRVRANAAASSCLIERRAGTGSTTATSRRDRLFRHLAGSFFLPTEAPTVAGTVLVEETAGIATAKLLPDTAGAMAAKMAQTPSEVFRGHAYRRR